MPEWWKELGPIGAILGALITSSISAFVTYRLMYKRQSVAFSLLTADDLARFLGSHSKITLSLEGKPISRLVRQEIVVLGRGNISISNFSFTCSVNGVNIVYLAEIFRTEAAIKSVVEIENYPSQDDSRTSKVSLSFFNPREKFIIRVLHDGDPDTLSVACRMQDVRVSIDKNPLLIYSTRRLHPYKVAKLSKVWRWMLMPALFPWVRL